MAATPGAGWSGGPEIVPPGAERCPSRRVRSAAYTRPMPLPRYAGYTDDDPSAWEAAPTEHPHDEVECEACHIWKLWHRERLVRSGRGRQFTRAVSDLAEYRALFPRRYEALRRYHLRVMETARLAQRAETGR